MPVSARRENKRLKCEKAMDPQVRLLLETTFEAFQTGMNLIPS